MRIGEFVKGIFNGTTESYQTEGVEKFLPPDEFDKLWNLEQIGIWTYTNPEYGVIARTMITKTSDGEFTGRKGIINHTVLVKFDATTVKDGCIYKLEPLSINQALANTLIILDKPIPDPLIQPLPPLSGGDIS